MCVANIEAIGCIHTISRQSHTNGKTIVKGYSADRSWIPDGSLFFRISHNLWKENTPILESTFSILVQLSAPLDLAANIKVLKLLLSKNCKYLLTNTLWRVNLIFRKFVNYCIFNWVTLTFSFWVIVLRVIYTVVYLFMTY